jgi:hypothetical protein
MPPSGGAKLPSPATPEPVQAKASGWLGVPASKPALIALAGTAVVLVGVLLFAIRHKVIPPAPPSGGTTLAVKNTEPPPATNQNQNLVSDQTITNLTQAEQQQAHKAPVKRTSQARPEETASKASSGTVPAAVESAPVTTIPAGTSVAIRMIDGIDPKQNNKGQQFHASFDSPVMIGDLVAIPKGADALVELVDASTAGHMSGRSSLTVKLVQVSVSGQNYPISSQSYVEQGSSRGKHSAGVIGGAAAVGAAIGGIFGHKKKKDAALGAAAGGGTGAAEQQLTNAQEVVIAPEEVIQFVLSSPLSIPQTQ